jgi:hypothetical protein
MDPVTPVFVSTELFLPGAPPPAIMNRFLTRHLITQRASCSERAASSNMSLFDPRTIIETVRPAFAIPVILTTLEEPILIYENVVLQV